MFLRQTIAALVVMLLAALPARALELIIVEQPGCYACKQWNAEIAPIYPKTEVGQFAPLRREQLNAPPDDVGGSGVRGGRSPSGKRIFVHKDFLIDVWV